MAIRTATITIAILAASSSFFAAPFTLASAIAHPPFRGFQILAVLKRISVERKARFGWQAFPETKLPALLQAGGTDFHAQTLLACTAASTSCDLQWIACAIADASLETGLAGLGQFGSSRQKPKRMLALPQ